MLPTKKPVETVTRIGVPRIGQVHFGRNPVTVNAAIIRRKDAKNRVESTVQLDRVSERAWVAMQTSIPETIAQNGEFSALIRL